MSQPAPVPNDRPPIAPQVIADIHARAMIGLEAYGVYLQPFNGRDALEDAYAESLDKSHYLKQAIIERDEFVAAVRELVAAIDDDDPYFYAVAVTDATDAVRKLLPPKA